MPATRRRLGPTPPPIRSPTTQTTSARRPGAATRRSCCPWAASLLRPPAAPGGACATAPPSSYAQHRRRSRSAPTSRKRLRSGTARGLASSPARAIGDGSTSMRELEASLAQIRNAWLAGRSALEQAPAQWREVLGDGDELALVALAGHATDVLTRQSPGALLVERPLLPALSAPHIPAALRPRFRRLLATPKNQPSLE